MELKDIKDLITALPFLIIYIVPGYIYIWIRSFLISEKKQEEGSLVIIKSIVISYIIIIIETGILNIFGYKQNLIFSNVGKCITIGISILASFIITKFILSDLCYKILKKIGINKSLRNDIWDDLVDLEYGLPIRVYLGDEMVVYYGDLRRYEEKKENESYLIVLSNYIVYNYDGDEIETFESDNTRYVVLNMKDITRIELIYHPESKKIHREIDNTDQQQATSNEGA